MDNRQIQYFTEVVKQGGFSKAAERLFVSQPTISNVVKSLENELGAQLIIRTTRKFELTETGELLYQYGEKISLLYKQFYKELEDVNEGNKGKIRMGIYSSVGTEILTEIMAGFSKEYPDIHIRFVEDGEENLKNALENDDLDLVVLGLPLDREYDHIPFLNGDLRLLVHHDHPLSQQKKVSWRDLKNEKFIIFQEGFAVRRYIMEQCNRAGFLPDISGETSQWKVIFEMVSCNMGISILPQSDFGEIKVAHKGMKVLPLIDETVEWETGIAWKKNSYTSQATRNWISFLDEKMKDIYISG